MDGLSEAAAVRREKSVYPFHMPGHKRNEGFFWADASCDLTELSDDTGLPGTDDLHDPHGAVSALQEAIARLYGAKESLLLVNGSTCGNQAALLASVQEGESVLVAANCHKSVWDALVLRDIVPFVMHPAYSPEGLWGVVTAQMTEEALCRCEAEGRPVRAVVITSPTYEGLAAEVADIAAAAHVHGAVLIVDSAHGAHVLGPDFRARCLRHPQLFGENPLEQGADLCVMSLHKTLPCYGQTACLHICGDRVRRQHIQEWVSILQTSSPSYLLMTQAEACVRWLKKEGASRMEAFLDRLFSFREAARSWKRLRLLEGTDASRLVIWTAEAGVPGTELARRLQTEYGLELELAAESFAVALTSVCDTPEGMNRLSVALSDIDTSLAAGISTEAVHPYETDGAVDFVTAPAVTPYRAFRSEGEWVPLSEAEGRIARRGAFVYPPGIPAPIPGGRIERAQIDALARALSAGCSARGIRDGRIECI